MPRIVYPTAKHGTFDSHDLNIFARRLLFSIALAFSFVILDCTHCIVSVTEFATFATDNFVLNHICDPKQSTFWSRLGDSRT